MSRILIESYDELLQVTSDESTNYMIINVCKRSEHTNTITSQLDISIDEIDELITMLQECKEDIKYKFPAKQWD